ncbi:hypothetical protein Cgig2_009304 [Carnegiea gigantea]|uniref:Cyclin-dependent kinase inhibitor n=1 Tax=Carnegiea gigantea TaxID=171969 RepID=A0A9Q1Q928_9CARY|nr:hypothetical protein Cgig2_009304 [Carnegiea gigantea]
MGKYMKKGKITADVAVMEIPQSGASLGVRTRARTLALQPNPELSYLQLRSRRLEKPPFQPSPTKPGNSRGRVGSVKSRSEEDRGRIDKGAVVGRCDSGEIEEFHDLGGEASCGENNLEFDSRERSTRESTPCSLIRGTETIGTPGSTTRPTCSASASRRGRNTQRAIPTTPEMEEFFAGFELHQQKQFIEKYNYDIMNDLPLPGRYEWVSVDN